LNPLVACSVVVQVNEILGLKARVIVCVKSGGCVLRGLVGDREHLEVQGFDISVAEETELSTDGFIEIGRFGGLRGMKQ
jgi:hypothetical protein